MGHSVTVHQLVSPDGGESYLNVVDNMPGRIAIWGNTYTTPTYLCQVGFMYYLVAFDNEAYADEWLQSEETKNFDKITRITTKIG